jgi:hypothetical protein
MILACPFVCGACETCHGLCANADPDNGSSPIHNPEDTDDCICRGAVQAGDVRLSPLELSSDLILPDSVHAQVSAAIPQAFVHLTIDGRPAGLASWGDSLTVRARLQNFRC